MARLISRLPLVALLASSTAVYAADSSNLQIHGFASQGYLTTTGNNIFGRSMGGGTFELNEFALNATATPIERLRIGVQVLAYDLGKYGNDKPQIDWAFGQYQVPTGDDTYDLTLVAGRFKAGLALYNDFRDLDMTRTSVFLPAGVYSAVFRDVFIATNGFQANLGINTESLGSFELSAFVGTQNISPDDGPIADAFKTAGVRELTSINLKRSDGGFLAWNTPLDGLKAKASAMHASHMRAEGRNRYVVGQNFPFPVPAPATGLVIGSVVDLPVNVDLIDYFDGTVGAEYQVGNWTLASEYSNTYYKAEIEATIPDMTNPSTTTLLKTNSYSRMVGAYGSLNYQLADLPNPLNRFQVMGAFNWIHDQQIEDAAKSFHRGAILAVRYDVTEHFLVKVEFQLNRGTLLIDSMDNPEGESLYWNVFALKTTFDF